MPSLYWNPPDGPTRNVAPLPFESEQKLEDYLVDNRALLGDVFIIGRQIRTGTGDGILDLIGVDKDHKLCVIELKNQEASADVLPQALSYAIWAETNPASVKNLWLELKDRPDDLEIDWDDLSVRIIVVAPSFGSDVARMAPKLGYTVQLLRVQRFRFDSDEFVLIDDVQQPPIGRVGIPKAQETYDRAFYEGSHGKQAVAQFLDAVGSLEEICKQQSWELTSKLNKYYAGFKYGTRLCFGIRWDSAHIWSVFVKVPREVASSFQVVNWVDKGYDDGWHETYFRPVSPERPDIPALVPIIKKAYELRAQTA